MMTTYHKDLQLPPDTPPRLYHRKKEMGSSMLQYSERMRVISAARVSLGDGLEVLERMNSRDSEKDRGWRNRNSVSMDRSSTQRTEQNHDQIKEQRDDKLPLIAPTTYKPRRQRPLSFDEKELKHNMSIIRTRQRPYSFDEREIKRIEAANAQFRSKQHREAFVEHAHPIVIPTSSVEEEVQTTEDTSEVKISFVSASDLYELVDINRQAKESSRSRNGAIKLVNVQDAVQFVQNLEAKSDGCGIRGESFSLRRKSDTKVCKNKLEKSKLATAKLEFKTNPVCKMESSAIKKSSNVRSGNKNVTPLSAFLTQAASDFASQNALSIRPKRAKRMSLLKPRLLDIPEADDSTLPPVGQHTFETARTVHHLTRMSPQTIKEVRGDKSEEGARLDISGLLLKSSGGDVNKQHPNKSSLCKVKQKQASKSSKSELDIDALLMTSIYPTVPWDPEDATKHSYNRQFVLPEKNSHKEKAHRKMKKLIFLRDRPDQHYRRDL